MPPIADTKADGQRRRSGPGAAILSLELRAIISLYAVQCVGGIHNAESRRD